VVRLEVYAGGVEVVEGVSGFGDAAIGFRESDFAILDRGNGLNSRGFGVWQWRYCEEGENLRQDVNELEWFSCV